MIFSDDDTVGKIVNAMVACTDPKTCSARLIRQYVMDFHPHLRAETGHFKRSLLTAVEQGTLRSDFFSSSLLQSFSCAFHQKERFAHCVMLTLNSRCRQLSGIGCSGTFQLVEKFVPGPHILAGKDTASDYEEVKILVCFLHSAEPQCVVLALSRLIVADGCGKC